MRQGAQWTHCFGIWAFFLAVLSGLTEKVCPFLVSNIALSAWFYAPLGSIFDRAKIDEKPA